MPNESFSTIYLNGLNDAWPVGGVDKVYHGDDQLRGLKTVLQRTFPNIAGVVNASHTELNNLFPTGGIVKLIFYMATPPTGWTADETLSGSTLRVVTAASTDGGSSGGIHDINTSMAHTHTIGHTHTYSGTTSVSSNYPYGHWANDTPVGHPYHTHTYSGTTSGASAGSSGGMSTSLTVPKYVNCILASKD